MTPAFLTETALLEVSRWQRDAHKPRTKTAPEVAASLWDERDEDTGRLRDLTATEQAFLTKVREIGQDYVAVVGEANRGFGTDSKVALAVEWTARQRRDERYQVALDRYLSEREC